MWRDWQSVWHSMAKDDFTQYTVIKATEEVEFYNLMEIQRDRLEKMRNQSNYNQSNHRRR
jgi:hypothetical protein